VFCLMALLHPIAIAMLWPVYTQGRSAINAADPVPAA
jgi:hypothetical protein